MQRLWRHHNKRHVIGYRWSTDVLLLSDTWQIIPSTGHWPLALKVDHLLYRAALFQHGVIKQNTVKASDVLRTFTLLLTICLILLCRLSCLVFQPVWTAKVQGLHGQRVWLRVMIFAIITYPSFINLILLQSYHNPIVYNNNTFFFPKIITTSFFLFQIFLSGSEIDQVWSLLDIFPSVITQSTGYIATCRHETAAF